MKKEKIPLNAGWRVKLQPTPGQQWGKKKFGVEGGSLSKELMEDHKRHKKN